MKKIILSIFAIALLANLFAQTPVHLESNKIGKRIFNKSFIPKVKGKLLNYSPIEDSTLSIQYTLVGLGVEIQKIKTTELLADGSFSLSLTHGLPYQQIWLSIGDHYYGEILADKDLEIIADLQLLKKNPILFYGEGIGFEGADSELNALVNQWIVYKNKQTDKWKKEKQGLTFNPGGDPLKKAARIREIYEEIAKIDQAFLNEHPSPYAWVIDNERLSDFYGDLFLIFWGKEISPELLTEALSHKPALVSNSSHSYYSYLSSMLSYPRPGENAQINQEVLAKQLDDSEQGRELKAFLDEYKKKSNDEFYNEDRYNAGKRFFILYKEELQAARDDLYLKRVSELPQKSADLVKIMGQPKDLYSRERYLRKLIPLTQTEWAKVLMKKNLKADQEHITSIESALKNSGNLEENHPLGENILNPNESTHLYVSGQEDIEGLMASLYSNYSQKSLILDVWATWCGPCISDMKQSVAIKKELKKLPLELVYLCVADGSDQEKWKKKVLELELSGTHVFLNKKLSTEFMQKFKLGGYPSYLFIDKERNIDKHYIQRISRIDVEELKKKL